MSPRQKKIFALLLGISAVVFALFILPNAAASENMAMVQMFEPDEAAPLPYALRMISPADNLDQALRAFIFYKYYYYGFPYFAVSALSVLPLQWMGRIDDLSLVMVMLRQLVSVLPMLAALLLLVYMQDGFRSYRSPVLFAFLLSVPAVVNNNFWWHPDSLTTLLVVLIIFFLARDNLRFGWNFLTAAALCGIVTATKLVGLYFFLAVGLTLLLGLILKKASWQRLAGMALAFLGIMGLAFLVGNPFLLSGWGRIEYFQVFNKQTTWLSQGYSVFYEKGLFSAWPVMREFYGEAVFLIIVVAAAVWGALRGPRRLLYSLILAWFVTVSVSVIWLTHFKFQYWLPAALPLFSCLAILLPEDWRTLLAKNKRSYAQAALLMVLFVQFALFVNRDLQSYTHRLYRAENNVRINFYHQSVETLAPLAGRQPDLLLYFDYRMYMPEKQGWATETNYELLEYNYIQQRDFDVLLLLEQRIRDYLNPEVQGVDPISFASNQQFYRDADNAAIQGYHLIYRDPVGLVYVRDNLYQQYFQPLE